MSNIPKGAKVFNFIRANMSEVYTETLPEASSDNIESLRSILFDENYKPMLNEFVNNLVNRIGLTIIRNQSYNNPLAMFKKGSVPMGSDIQELYENPAVAEKFAINNTEMSKLLTVTDPDTAVAYYQRNRQDLYTKTISRQALQAAFTDWNTFESYITGITNSLYSGNFISEFNYTKDLIEGAYENAKIPTLKIDPSNPDGIIIKLKETYAKMKFPSSKFNSYSLFNPNKKERITWTPAERLTLIIPAGYNAVLDVTVLAKAFNIEYSKFIGRIVEIDEFKSPNLFCILCDESWLQIYDNLLQFDEFYNARTMTWNEYLHAWGTYAISPFANAVAFEFSTAPEVVPLKSITIGADPVELDLSTTPQGEELEVTLDPVNATTHIDYSSNNEEVFTAENVTGFNNKVKITPISTGEAKLIANSVNGIETSVSVKVIKS